VTQGEVVRADVARRKNSLSLSLSLSLSVSWKPRDPPVESPSVDGPLGKFLSPFVSQLPFLPKAKSLLVQEVARKSGRSCPLEMLLETITRVSERRVGALLSSGAYGS